jgi:hypothetical protein
MAPRQSIRNGQMQTLPGDAYNFIADRAKKEERSQVAATTDGSDLQSKRNAHVGEMSMPALYGLERGFFIAWRSRTYLHGTHLIHVRKCIH